jgi:hypothetical protein
VTTRVGPSPWPRPARAWPGLEPILRTQATDAYAECRRPRSACPRRLRTGSTTSTYRRDEAVPLKPKDVMRACMHAYDSRRRHPQRHRPDGGLRHPGDRPLPPQRADREVLQGVVPPGQWQGTLRTLPQSALSLRQRRHPADDGQAAGPGRGTDAAGQGRARRRPPSPCPALGRREVPWTYTFLNPLNVEVLGDELAVFVGQHAFMYGINIPMSLAKKIKQAGERPRAGAGRHAAEGHRRCHRSRATASSRSTVTRSAASTTSATTGTSGPSPLVYSILSDISAPARR